MKLRHAITAGVLTFCAAANGSVVISDDEKSLEARLFEATDARNANDGVFQEALNQGDWRALVMLGQIGGTACKELYAYLGSRATPEALAAARHGAALCMDEVLGDSMIAFPKPVPADVGVDYLMPALGFSGGPAARPFLIEAVNAIKPGQPSDIGFPGNPRTLPLYGLMQAIVYDRLPATELAGLDYQNLLALAGESGTGDAAAYLLTRVTGLNDILAMPDVLAVIGRSESDRVRTALIRLLGQYGDAAVPALLDIAKSGDAPVRYEAVRALGRMTDEASKAFLVAAFGGKDVFVRQLALAGLSARAAEDIDARALVRRALDDSNRWIAATALEGLVGFDESSANAQAGLWLEGQDYYLAYKAMNVLSNTESGKVVLERYAGTHPGTVRGRDAAVALDPSIEANTVPRATVPYAETQAYIGKRLRLNTTRGVIEIKMSADAPYAATNFLKLAEAGKMDGMLWHRVIPNFVAQAGQIEDPEINDWGSIREEWTVSDHRPGTVGLATAGKDTGGTQFFINTAYNMHLNGRYTVFGYVTRGLDIAYALQEGDVIEKAEVLD